MVEPFVGGGYDLMFAMDVPLIPADSQRFSRCSPSPERDSTRQALAAFPNESAELVL